MEVWGFIGLGLLPGFMLGYFINYKEKQDLIDRLTWRDPADFFLMKFNREQANGIKPSFKFPNLVKLTKREPKVLTPEEQVANKISAQEVQVDQFNQYLEAKQKLDIKTEEQVRKEMSLNGNPMA